MIEREAPVVVVDDDLSVRRGLERLLRSYGYRVATFASAREFLVGGQAERPACLVLDVRMPGQSGLELHELLMADDHQVPVVFITGHADIPLSVRALKAGAADVLTKPFDDRKLLDTIQQAMARAAHARNEPPIRRR
jgi:FixJ family two-component response regulator